MCALLMPKPKIDHQQIFAVLGSAKSVVCKGRAKKVGRGKRFESAKAYNTRDSQAVSDPSTNQAQRCLTCQIGRDGVLSTWYGRKRTLG